jgi:hypothetical protein
VLAAAAVPVYHDSRDREVKEQAQAEMDVLLIEKVNAQLSRTAPVAMGPLMQLMIVSDSGSDSNPAKRNEPRKNANGGLK